MGRFNANDGLQGKEIELQFSLLQELYLFKRNSRLEVCQTDFDRKTLRGNFPKDEIELAVNAFNAVVVTSLTA